MNPFSTNTNSVLIGSNIIQIEETSSTNDVAEAMMRNEPVADGTLIWAHYQTCGRGEGGNTWESKAGKNLTISIILRPEFLEPRHQFYISKIIALGIKDFINLFSDGVTIKWPNDIYVKDDKISGILIENSFLGDKYSYCVVGIGININQRRFSSNLINPTSLSLITNHSFVLKECLFLLISLLDNRYITLKENKFDQIDRDYNNNLYRYKKIHSYETPDGIIQAEIIGVKKTGEIMLSVTDNKIRSFGFKEVGYL